MRNRPLAKPDEALAGLRVERRQGSLRLIPSGEWNVGQSPRLDALLQDVKPSGIRDADIDGSGITELDSAGAWLLLRTKRELEQGGAAGALVDVPVAMEKNVKLEIVVGLISRTGA